MNFTSIFFLILAVIILAYLRSILGQRTGNERPHHDNNHREQKQDAREANDNVVALPGRRNEPQNIALDQEELEEELEKFASGNEDLLAQIKDLMNKDSNFHPGSFLDGAKMAYEMIVTSYSSGDSKALKPLLGRDVYESFETAISDRKSRDETVDFTFIGIDKADLKTIEYVNQDVQVTVQFSSQLISATRNKAGDVIDGDPELLVDVNDIWTFIRPMASRDPNWKLIATETV